jgi:hypothetical protein
MFDTLAESIPDRLLAHLQLGKAFILSGGKVKAKAAYQDFLTLWKKRRSRHPNPETAQAEYAMLR